MKSEKIDQALKRCLCGEWLHYSDPKQQAMVQALVDKLGECVEVKYGSQSYFVPRHYIALHGIKGVDLPNLAQRYNLKVK